MEYVCKTCGMSFKSTKTRDTHNHKVHSVCKTCGKIFKTKKELAAHVAKSHKKK